ncbi:MAG: hypothetical protein R3C01_03815 [Planctomycetaceae bacterium]
MKRLQPLAMALVMVVALHFCWAFLYGIGIETVMDWSGGQSETVYEQLFSDGQGTVSIRHTETRASLRNPQVETWRVVSKAPHLRGGVVGLAAGDNSDQDSKRKGSLGVSPDRWPAAYVSGELAVIGRPERLDLVTLLPGFAQTNQPWQSTATRDYGIEGHPDLEMEQSVFVRFHPQQDGMYFTLMDPKTRVVVGHLGQSGFREETPPESEWFLVSSHTSYLQNSGIMVDWGRLSDLRRSLIMEQEHSPWRLPEAESVLRLRQVVLLADGKVYLIDFQHRTTTELLDWRHDVLGVSVSVMLPRVTSEGSVDGNSVSPTGNDSPSATGEVVEGNTLEATRRVVELSQEGELGILLRTLTSLLLWQGEGKPVREIPLPHDIQPHAITVTPYAGGFVLIQNVVQKDSSESESSSRENETISSAGSPYRVWWVEGGQVVQKEDVSLLYTIRQRGNGDTTMNRLFAGLAGSPLAMGLLNYGTIPWTTANTYHEGTFGEILAAMWRDTWWLLGLMVLLSLGLMKCVDWRLHRSGLGRDWGWLTFVFLFGLPGYVAFILHRSWPSPVPPAPAPNGLDIFA